MSVLGLIFSNIHSKEVFEVTQNRTIASTPIGGRYRLIDFTLSCMVNAGISNIGVITKSNYQSLMDHVGSGKEWDLARKKGGLVILPPYGVSNSVYNTRLEAVKGIISFIKHSTAEYVVLSDCYHVCNIDFKDIFRYHHEKEADITCVYHECKVCSDDYMPINKFELDENERVVGMDILPIFSGNANISMDIWIMKKELLERLTQEAITTNYRSFNRDILSKNLGNLKIYGYRFNGFFGNISSLQSYYNVNKSLLKKEIRDEVFNQLGRSIYTKVRDSAPTRYCYGSKAVNSLIADGCIIEGEVYNSVIFRGTKIGKGCVIKDSILMQDTKVYDGIHLEYVITDKEVVIETKKELRGSAEYPIYVKKGGVL
ncbi:MAG: glucose-1-phosphate adenylyltransferase subunit GlgD [Bacilli bacterium]|nr:glucose-1-phosphate adenylyltransferase subunit GlgD [Bacilli bacterium]